MYTVMVGFLTKSGDDMDLRNNALHRALLKFCLMEFLGHPQRKIMWNKVHKSQEGGKITYK